MTHEFKSPKYYAALRAEERKRETNFKSQAVEAPSVKHQALKVSSSKRQAPSNKLQASSRKRQAP